MPGLYMKEAEMKKNRNKIAVCAFLSMLMIWGMNAEAGIAEDGGNTPKQETASQGSPAQDTDGGADNKRESSQTYEVRQATETNCKIYINGSEGPVKVKAGEKVTIAVRTDNGLRLRVLAAVNQSEQRISLTELGNGGYAFTMPATGVAVSAVAGEIAASGSVSARNLKASQTYKVTASEYRYPETNPNGTQIIGEYLEFNDSIPGFCMQHLVNAPAVGTVYEIVDTYTAENKKNELIRKILYYGWHGPGDLGIGYQTTHLACSAAIGFPDSAWEVGRKFVERVSDLPAAPKNFRVHVLSCGKSGVQQVAIWEYEENGYGKLKKVSTNTDLTEGNGNYSLEGAKYGVYKDKECKTKAGVLTTDENGNTDSLELEAGTYYVKETKAPEGFALDTALYTFKVKEGETAAVTVKDAPQYAPADLLLEKYDSETKYGEEGNNPQGKGRLQGARFQVRFYGGQYKTEEELEGKKPLRTWTFASDEKGRVEFSKAYLLEGDGLWTDKDGKAVFPLGTVTIREMKAPEGYLPNETLFISRITPEGSKETVKAWQTVKVPEKIIRGDLEIIKVYQPSDEEEETLQGIEGVEFAITSKTTGEEVMRIVTDKEGKATTKREEYPRGSLLFDTYVITETKAPEGYNPIEPFEVTIREEGVTLTGIYKQDTLISCPVQIVKIDESTGKAVPRAGAKFQLLDENKEVVKMTVRYPAVKEIDVFETDENGSFVFPEVPKAGVYYLREIEAPEGYLLNKEELQFTVSKDTDWGNPLVVKFADENAMGKIRLEKLKKVGEDGEKIYLEDVEFEIRAAEDIKTPDGTVRLGKGELADTLVTSGEAVESKELFLGKYIVKETKQKPGYARPGQEYETELKYEGQETKVVTETVTVYNAPTTVIIHKYEKGGKKETLLEGVEFTVWESSDNSKTYTTDSDGEIRILYLLPDTTYYIKETKALPGYLPDEEIREIKVDEAGYISGRDTCELTWENDYTKVKVSKKDASGKQELKGAKLKLEYEAETKERQIVKEWTTDGKARKFTHLTPGKYILTETEAPAGYEPAEPVTFTVKATGQWQEIVMYDAAVATPAASVRTGDSADLIILAGAMAAAAGTCAVNIHLRRKRRRR